MAHATGLTAEKGQLSHLHSGQLRKKLQPPDFFVIQVFFLFSFLQEATVQSHVLLCEIAVNIKWSFKLRWAPIRCDQAEQLAPKCPSLCPAWSLDAMFYFPVSKRILCTPKKRGALKKKVRKNLLQKTWLSSFFLLLPRGFVQYTWPYVLCCYQICCVRELHSISLLLPCELPPIFENN